MPTTRPLALLLFVAAGTLAACSRESTAADNKSTTGSKVQSTIDAGKEKLAAAQQEFRAQTDMKLKEVDSSIANLKKSASEATGEAQTKLNDAVQSMEAKREQLANKIAEWKTITADKWQTFTADVSRMVEDLRRESAQALDKVK